MPNKTRVAIVGKGDFGTTLGDLLREVGQSDFSYCSRAKRGKYEGTYSPEQLERLTKAEVVVLAVSSKAVPTVARIIQPYVPASAILLSTVKSIWYDSEQKQLFTTTDLLKEFFPNNVLAAMSGPNLAAEIKKKLPTSTWIAVEPMRWRKYIVQAENLCRLFRTPKFKAIPWFELKGIEYGGALKNPPAIAAGFVRAYQGHSCNNHGDLMEWAQEDCRDIYEKISSMRFGRPHRLPMGFLGDLVATSLSKTSRNYQFGRDLGRAWKQNDQSQVQAVIKDAQNKTVEGLRTLEDVCTFAEEHHIPTLLLSTLYGVIFKGKDPAELNFDEMTERVKKVYIAKFKSYLNNEEIRTPK